jgi:hypothetical protein
MWKQIDWTTVAVAAVAGGLFLWALARLASVSY